MWRPYGESLHAFFPLFPFFSSYNVFFGLCTTYFAATHNRFLYKQSSLGDSDLFSFTLSRFCGLSDRIWGFFPTSLGAFTSPCLLLLGLPRSIYLELLPRDPTVFSLLWGTSLGGCSSGVATSRVTRLEHCLSGLLLFPDVGTGLFSESTNGGSPEGFISPYLPPSNLNGWDNALGIVATSEPLSLVESQDPHSINKHRKQNKCIGVFSDSSNLILGKDLSMAEVVEMEDKLVVGKVYGRHFNEKNLKAWVVSTWGASQSPSPQVRRLSLGWFLIIFLAAEQDSQALLRCWTIDSSLVLLKPSDPTFDASSERMDSFPIWV
jgi:hypothetical protein